MPGFDWKRFRGAYLEARRIFLPYVGVLGVGYELASTHGHEKVPRPVITVLVNMKLIQPGETTDQTIPSIFQGFPVVVREPRLKSDDEDRHSPYSSHAELLMINWGKVHRMHLEASVKAAPGAPPRTDVVGQIFVIEDNGALTMGPGITGFDSVDWAQAYKFFRLSWKDDYDFVALIVDTDSGMPNPGNSWGITVYNEVAGINHYEGDIYDDRNAYGGSSRLLGVQAFRPPLNQFVYLHEVGHQWGPYVLFRTAAAPWDHADLLRDDFKHWSESFDNDFSPMDYDLVDLQDNSDGTFSDIPILDDGFGYCPLDLYLMGMLGPAEVPPFYYVQNFRFDPNLGVYRGMRTDLTIADIASVPVQGWRNPTSANSARSFRQAFVVLTKNLPAGKVLAASIENDRVAYSMGFRSATQSRSVVDSYLYRDSYDHVYIQDDPADTGHEPSGGSFWNSHDIWVRNADDGGTAHQDTIRNQTNYVYVRVRNTGSQDSREITVNLFRANYAGTEFLYPEDWRMEDLIGTRIVASVPGSGEVIVRFTWDSSKIPDASWHPCLLAEILPIHRAKTLLRYVWEDRRLAQKNITIADPPAMGEPLLFPFLIGSKSRPDRLLRIHLRQKSGRTLTRVTLQLGQEDWAARLGSEESHEMRNTDVQGSPIARLQRLARNGDFTERDGSLVFALSDALRGGEIGLPLRETERHKLILQVQLDHEHSRDDVQFEIIQLNERGQAIGGLDLVIRGRSSKA